ncbi:MAG: YezD family protein [Puniceicoccales bacterium]|nr:YezD family protein [Puniceicoccales bacterium]
MPAAKIKDRRYIKPPPPEKATTGGDPSGVIEIIEKAAPPPAAPLLPRAHATGTGTTGTGCGCSSAGGTTGTAAPPPADYCETDAGRWVRVVRRMISNLEFGEIQLTIHRGRVTEVRKMEKFRFDTPCTCGGTGGGHSAYD